VVAEVVEAVLMEMAQEAEVVLAVIDVLSLVSHLVVVLLLNLH
jgi:hypothetical protein